MRRTRTNTQHMLWGAKGPVLRPIQLCTHYPHRVMRATFMRIGIHICVVWRVGKFYSLVDRAFGAEEREGVRNLFRKAALEGDLLRNRPDSITRRICA